MSSKFLSLILVLPLAGAALAASAAQGPIIQDTEYYILESQHGERWADDDARVDDRLGEFRAGNAFLADDVDTPGHTTRTIDGAAELLFVRLPEGGFWSSD